MCPVWITTWYVWVHFRIWSQMQRVHTRTDVSICAILPLNPTIRVWTSVDFHIFVIFVTIHFLSHEIAQQFVSNFHHTNHFWWNIISCVDGSNKFILLVRCSSFIVVCHSSFIMKCVCAHVQPFRVSKQTHTFMAHIIQIDRNGKHQHILTHSLIHLNMCL